MPLLTLICVHRYLIRKGLLINKLKSYIQWPLRSNSIAFKMSAPTVIETLAN